MEKMICFLIFSVICLHSALALIAKPRIIGGQYVEVTQYPYQATLVHDGFSYCGATIIAKQWLLTAGHCVKEYNATDIKARTGASKRHNDGELHEVEEIIIHTDLEVHSYSITNDIALVKLTKPIVFSNKQKSIPLAEPTDEYPHGKILAISGFGHDEIFSENKVDHLKAVYIRVVNRTKCQEDYYLEPITDHMICAGDHGDSPCTGDSGGPAVADGKLAGVISTGFHCDTTNVPGIFTAVNKYVDWISKYVQFN